MLEQLEDIKKRYQDITEQISLPEVISDNALFQKLTKEHSKLSELIEIYNRYCAINTNIKSNTQLVDDPDEDQELRNIANEEIESDKKQLEELEQKIQILLLPEDPNDTRDVILEIRAGTGGDEAALFARDLFRMYLKYAEAHRWKTEILSEAQNDIGGFKEVVIAIHGTAVYSYLKFEGGVHRVQRVPKTETQGRVHTSAVTVAIMPEAEEVEVEISPNDLRIDVFRSSGPGGQSVNTTDSAVRITHLPTGMVVSCQNEKSQLKNKDQAMKVLRARLYEQELASQQAELSQQRKSMVGSGDRSERIRTYNFPQGRVTDHRINLTLYQLEQILLGQVTPLIDALRTDYQAKLLKEGLNA